MAFLGAAAPAIIGGVTDIVSAVVKKYIPDPKAQAELELEIYKTLQTSDLAQLDVNKQEASSQSIFVAGWRPFIGWICGLSIAWQFVVKGWAYVIVANISDKAATAVLNSPGMDNNMWELVLAMLGLGAMRSYDKMKGTVNGH